jgi:DNA-binding NtrC family response regulator
MNNMDYNLIIADDDPTIRNLLEVKAAHYGFQPITAENGQQVINLVTESTEVVLLDLNMPEMDGFECLERLRVAHPTVQVVILTGENEADTAMKAIKLGAHDYLTKPFDLNHLFTTLRNAKKLNKLQLENQSLKDNIAPSSSAPNLIAHSDLMQDLLTKARKVAALDSSILLTGPSGSGKGVLASYIHAHSPRASMPFVTVSCPALPRELLESELFGHEKGAFTGALKRRIGKIEAAKGGTLFLDEIGDLPLDLQPKLLNVLQDKIFHRIGGEKTLNCDIRIITATNLDFKKKIESKEFRQDLYYRISVIPLDLPPLVARPQEILPLAEYFLERISKQRNQPVIKLSDTAKEKLIQYEWPGNVRQLENLIERASAFCVDHTIHAEDLIGSIDSQESENYSTSGLAGKTLEEIEKLAIQQTLNMCNGNKAETARKLGITEKTIYNKMKRLSI